MNWRLEWLLCSGTVFRIRLSGGRGEWRAGRFEELPRGPSDVEGLAGSARVQNFYRQLLEFDAIGEAVDFSIYFQESGRRMPRIISTR